jgi:hypothetical protein
VTFAQKMMSVLKKTNKTQKKPLRGGFLGGFFFGFFGRVFYCQPQTPSMVSLNIPVSSSGDGGSGRIGFQQSRPTGGQGGCI